MGNHFSAHDRLLLVPLGEIDIRPHTLYNFVFHHPVIFVERRLRYNLKPPSSAAPNTDSILSHSVAHVFRLSRSERRCRACVVRILTPQPDICYQLPWPVSLFSPNPSVSAQTVDP